MSTGYNADIFDINEQHMLFVKQFSKMHWTLCALIIGSFGCKYIHAQAQRVPPGVPPQHYQQVGSQV